MMSKAKVNGLRKLCNFAPDGSGSNEVDVRRGDAILYRKVRTLDELDESSDRCLKHVSERLDQLEEEILAGSANEKTD